MSLKRRHFLTFLGAAAGTSALSALGHQSSSYQPGTPTKNSSVFGHFTESNFANRLSQTPPAPFQPLQSPLPYEAIPISPDQQPLAYAEYAIQDDIVLPEGFTYDVIGSWGDPVGDSRFGYNNDYCTRRLG